VTCDSLHPDAFIRAVAAAIDAYDLIPAHSGVVVGVSGGADNVALLSALHELGRHDRRAYGLTVAHLHHALRESADADAAFVAELAERLGLSCVGERCDVAAVAAETGESIETAARTVRYEFFRRLAQSLGALCVAVGHHADDNVETVLYRILRGTHLRGLAGIPIQRTLGETNIRLIRPLLHCRREDVEAYCTRAGLAYRTDETNLETRYRRNFIRHELLPLLRERLNPRVDEALLRLAASADDAEAHLAHLGAEILRRARLDSSSTGCQLDRRILADAPPLVAAYALRQALEQASVPWRSVGADRMADLAALLTDSGPSAVALGGQFIARRRGERIVISRRGDPDEPGDEAEVVVLSCPGQTVLADGREVCCRVEALDREAFEGHCRRHARGVEYLDADALTGPLTCRPRREGDMFHPLGAPGRQNVGDFLTNAKVPLKSRRRVRCICDDLGMVYVAPFRIDERAKVTADTRRVVRVEIRGVTDSHT